ncbi:unnamed protein product, partial [Mesorhabditis spiculigera]
MSPKFWITVVIIFYILNTFSISTIIELLPFETAPSSSQLQLIFAEYPCMSELLHYPFVYAATNGDFPYTKVPIITREASMKRHHRSSIAGETHKFEHRLLIAYVKAQIKSPMHLFGPLTFR